MFCRACGNAMAENDIKGSIVTISSIMGRATHNMTGAYASSKSAVIMFTRSLSKCFAPMGIRVNGIAPGFVLLPTDGSITNPDLAIQNPLKKQVAMESITETVKFLLSNKDITGQIVFVDGGEHL